MAEKFVLATHNPGKLREMSDILSKFGIQVVSPADVGITVDVEETGTTFAENAMLKAKAICEASGLRAIADDPETRIDGFILPGHVSTITGIEPYRFLVDEFSIPGVVTGFEPVDILEGIEMLARMVVEGKPRIENAYLRGVSADGNRVARELATQVFEPCDATWRGLGKLPQSGLRIRQEFARFDASRRFDVAIEPTVEPRGCRCGDVLRGRIAPTGCPLFGTACTPEHPVGPCMVSSEGSCAAYFRYREE